MEIKTVSLKELNKSLYNYLYIVWRFHLFGCDVAMHRIPQYLRSLCGLRITVREPMKCHGLQMIFFSPFAIGVDPCGIMSID